MVSWHHGRLTAKLSGSKVGSKHILFQNFFAAAYGACFSLPLVPLVTPPALPKVDGGEEPRKLNCGELPMLPDLG